MDEQVKEKQEKLDAAEKEAKNNKANQVQKENYQMRKLLVHLKNIADKYISQTKRLEEERDHCLKVIKEKESDEIRF